MKKRILTAAALGLAAAFAISGCSAAGPNSGGGASHVLTIGMPNGTQTDNSNPFVNTSSAMSLGYAFAIYEPLVQVNPTNPSVEPKPWLASDYKWNDDYTAVTFTARDNVKWSDGKDFTAKDIAFTFNLLKDNPATNLNALPFGDIETDGDKVTVNFESGQFTNQYKALNLFVVPEHIWSKVSDVTTDLNKKPVGTGPYVLKSWTPQAATLTARTDYWGGTPAVPELRYSSYTDNNALTTALATGEVQWGWTFIADIDNVYVSKDAENNKFYAPAGLGADVLFLNTETKPFNDVAVRKALNLVVDRKVIQQQATAGVFPALENVTGMPTPAGDKYLASEYKDKTYKVDLDAAKAVLADAGYTLDGDVLKDPSGEAVTFTLTNPAGWNDYLTELQIVADAAKDLGITATVDAANQDAWFTAIAAGDFQASMHWTDSGPTPWDMYADVIDGAQVVPLGEKANWNFGRYNNDEATDALKTFRTTTDEDERQAAIEKVQKIVVDDVPALFIVTRPAAAEYSTKYYVGWPDEKNPYNQPQPTGPQASQILMSLKAK
jgi:peptide/nickel transport system substrate-binding protein